ncbi:hypothetical protein [Gandjariella thermophila]|uniref:Uncharacterized protein n=1 Tax=Gandjariella thermophila TaxID=1931992 RepID=A0A4D4JI20_9PSEU|nr:hypothetical protein [Gandjariella thermophila]GDY33919.1 hypothetical protein GTS_55520 [Gandjariella thermophila]
MGIAALITWVVTAAGGFVMLGTWVAKGGLRQQAEASSPRSSFPPALIFGHFVLAAVGLLVWIVYLLLDKAVLAWIAFGLLVPVALLGFVMLARWLAVYRSRGAVTISTGGSTSAAGGTTAATTNGPAEGHFPVPVVVGHGLLAVATVVLVLLTALGVAGS